jgi:osmotically-inducible protein OsmY
MMIEIQPSNLDEQLRSAILAVLAAEGQTGGADLRVGVLNGIVHLAGSVDSLQKRARAEELAEGVSGVRGVVNRIEAPGAPSPAREINLDLKTPSNCSDSGG